MTAFMLVDLEFRRAGFESGSGPVSCVTLGKLFNLFGSLVL